MDNESGGGSFLTRKFAGIPAWVILAGVAALAYFLFMRNQGQTPTNSTSGGGGQVHTGKTVVQSGAVRINVSGGDGGDEPQPKPPPHPGGGFKTKSFTVPKDETLAQFAASRHWSQDTIADISHWKQPKGSTYAGTELNPDQKLKKGDKIFRQLGN
jgi:hypothetical protein